jgi:hypothetical protein
MNNLISNQVLISSKTFRAEGTFPHNHGRKAGRLPAVDLKSESVVVACSENRSSGSFCFSERPLVIQIII